MPLPKPPAKRAALLDPADFDLRAAPKPGKRSVKAQAAAEEPAALHVFDPREAAGALIAPALVDELEAPRPARRPSPEPKARKPAGTGPAKLFVLDTNVLMHDPMSLFRFDEHDVYLPMIT